MSEQLAQHLRLAWGHPPKARNSPYDPPLLAAATADGRLTAAATLAPRRWARWRGPRPLDFRPLDPIPASAGLDDPNLDAFSLDDWDPELTNPRTGKRGPVRVHTLTFQGPRDAALVVTALAAGFRTRPQLIAAICAGLTPLARAVYGSSVRVAPEGDGAVLLAPAARAAAILAGVDRPAG